MANVKHEKLKSYSEYARGVQSTFRHTKTGQVFNRGNYLGKGGFSRCYSVTEQETNKKFACKVVGLALFREKPDYKHMIKLEIEILKAVKHPHIVEFIDSFKDDTYWYILQALCTNHTLRSFYKDGGVDDDKCRYFIYQTLQAVEYLEQKHIVHRDLKLENIFLDDGWQVKIGDFGLALYMKDMRNKVTEICGTTSYLAPEVLQRRGFTFKADVWAIGVMMYMLLTGRMPFDGEDKEKTYKRIIAVDYTQPPTMSAQAKEMLNSIFRTDYVNRPSAGECLRMSFINNHFIPPTLQIELAHHFEAEENFDDPFDEPIIFPVVLIKNEATLQPSFENNKHAPVVKVLHERFHSICRYHVLRSDDFLIDNYADNRKLRPFYWTTKWVFDDGLKYGFAYRFPNDAIGMLFFDGVKMVQPHEKDELFVSEFGDERMKKFSLTQKLSDDIEDKLYAFEYFRGHLQRKFVIPFDDLPPNTANTIPYLHTWFQTDDAILMLLSNSTIQVNFSFDHQKIIICPNESTITFIDEYYHFKTVQFTTIAAEGFSRDDYERFKYLTAILKCLSSKLDEMSIGFQ